MPHLRCGNQHRLDAERKNLFHYYIVGAPKTYRLVEPTDRGPQDSADHVAPAGEVFPVYGAGRVRGDAALPRITGTCRRHHRIVSQDQVVQPAVLEKEVIVGDHDPVGRPHPSAAIGEPVVVEWLRRVHGLCSLVSDAGLLLQDDDVDRHRIGPGDARVDGSLRRLLQPARTGIGQDDHVDDRRCVRPDPHRSSSVLLCLGRRAVVVVVIQDPVDPVLGLQVRAQQLAVRRILRVGQVRERHRSGDLAPDAADVVRQPMVFVGGVAVLPVVLGVAANLRRAAVDRDRSKEGDHVYAGVGVDRSQHSGDHVRLDPVVVVDELHVLALCGIGHDVSFLAEHHLLVVDQDHDLHPFPIFLGEGVPLGPDLILDRPAEREIAGVGRADQDGECDAGRSVAAGVVGADDHSGGSTGVGGRGTRSELVNDGPLRVATFPISDVSTESTAPPSAKPPTTGQSTVKALTAIVSPPILRKAT